MEWMDQNGWLAWMGLALVLVAIEAMTVDLVFVMLAGGAVAAAIVAALGGGLELQVVVAVVVALLLVGVVRPIAKRQLTRRGDSGPIGAAALVGREARVLEPVTEVDGRVRLAGETWSARVPDDVRRIEPGEEVRVLRIEGAVAVVVPEEPGAR